MRREKPETALLSTKEPECESWENAQSNCIADARDSWLHSILPARARNQDGIAQERSAGALLSHTLKSYESHKTPIRFWRILYQHKSCHPELKGTEGQKEARTAVRAEQSLQRAESAQAQREGRPPTRGCPLPGSAGPRGQSTGSRDSSQALNPAGICPAGFQAC